ncbi:MAG TPA: mechanosensitive ion channel family protein, partial [Gammaproteobacteria bacterium]|nr:mechanosensitive ion channel family protein [Gammaproteobacteria bacterium]
AHVVPARLLLAAVMFALFLGASRWIRRRMAEHWLVGVRMERGAREALVTITGYVSLAVGLLVVLSVAGVNLTNLAIIAGALSVGIGFGLQNIVNNFVSGIILLFERPIKTGDWIVVGDVEGHVKRISVRSTIIQTFDWADVIVPNSDLISGKVTNWMLRDPWGRVRVPVGVAYGSDTALVKELLLEVAKAHPAVLPGGHVPAPIVLFLGFGDSALNFELRCFIRNVDRRIGVLSDLNFAVDAVFRAHDVEIPFPQRDLHVRDWQPPPGPG